MTQAMGTTVLQGLPDRLDPECLTGMDSDVEVCPLRHLESFDVTLRRMPFLLAGQVKTDHAIAAEIDRQLRRLERVRPIAHGADDQSPTHSVLPLTATQAGYH